MSVAYIHKAIDQKGAAFEADLDVLHAGGLRLHEVAEAIVLFYHDSWLHAWREFDLWVEMLHAAVAAKAFTHLLGLLSLFCKFL